MVGADDVDKTVAIRGSGHSMKRAGRRKIPIKLLKATADAGKVRAARGYNMYMYCTLCMDVSLHVQLAKQFIWISDLL